MGRRAALTRNAGRTDDAHAGLQSQSEVVWKDMTAVETDDSDRWNDVEEHLLRSQDHDAKRWKFFAK